MTLSAVAQALMFETERTERPSGASSIRRRLPYHFCARRFPRIAPWNVSARYSSIPFVEDGIVTSAWVNVSGTLLPVEAG